MKKAILMSTILLIFFGFTTKQQQEYDITIAGSEALYPVFKELIKEYKNYEDADTEFSLASGGSTLGIVNLLSGDVDIATSTRNLTDREISEFEEKGIRVRKVNFAKEAFLVIVNKHNPVYKLTRQQVKDIFTGKIRNWKDVGGKDEQIRIFTRSNTSACYMGFRNTFMDGEPYHFSSLMLTSNKTLTHQIHTHRNSIGYLGFGNINNKVKMLSIGDTIPGTPGITYVRPTFQNLKSHKYPFTRDCYMFYRAVEEPRLKPFIDFLFSERGDFVLKYHNYVLVSDLENTETGNNTPE